jgi:hypothetical protein
MDNFFDEVCIFLGQLFWVILFLFSCSSAYVFGCRFLFNDFEILYKYNVCYFLTDVFIVWAILYACFPLHLDYTKYYGKIRGTIAILIITGRVLYTSPYFLMRIHLKYSQDLAQARGQIFDTNTNRFYKDKNLS